MAGARLNRGNYERGTDRAARRWGNRVGMEVQGEARRRCPVDEGALRASIDYTVAVRGSRAEVVIGSDKEYAAYVHGGTGIYGPTGAPITPVTAKALKFKWDGGGGNFRSKDKRPYVFAKSVRGQKAQPFLADALEAVMGNITRRRRI